MRPRDGLDGLSAFELAKAAGFRGDTKAWLESLRGPSAYELARAKGFTGTEDEWLASLRGRDGEKGDPGRDGQDGRDGKDVDMAAVRALVATAVAKIPRAKDGKDGADAVLPAPTPWLADYQEGEDGLTARVVVTPVDPNFPTWVLLPTRRADKRITYVQLIPQAA